MLSIKFLSDSAKNNTLTTRSYGGGVGAPAASWPAYWCRATLETMSCWGIVFGHPRPLTRPFEPARSHPLDHKSIDEQIIWGRPFFQKLSHQDLARTWSCLPLVDCSSMTLWSSGWDRAGSKGRASGPGCPNMPQHAPRVARRQYGRQGRPQDRPRRRCMPQFSKYYFLHYLTRNPSWGN